MTTLLPCNKPEMREWRDQLRDFHARGVPQARARLAVVLGVGPHAGRVGFCCLGVRCEAGVAAGRLRRLAVRGASSTVHASDVTIYEMGNRPADVILYREVVTRSDNETWLPESEGKLLLGSPEYPQVPHKPIVLYRPDLRGRDQRRLIVTASEANDNHGLTFDQIADCLTYTYGLDD